MRESKYIRKINHSLGFTLVELAIVLIIIGLITGGVVGAQSLIESSKVSRTIQDFNKYSSAIKIFELEYGGLPGDFDEAEDYWGRYPGDGDDSTINGTGNKRYERYEYQRFWQHLSLAEIVPFSKEYISSIPDVGVHVPGSHFSNNLIYRTEYLENNGTIGNVIFLADINFYPGTSHYVIPVKAAKAIDNKLDDGMPNTGILRGSRSLGAPGTGCKSSDSDINATYLLSVEENGCGIIYYID